MAGQVANLFPDITSLENTDLVLAWEASPGRVVNITLSALRDFLNNGAISTVDDVDLTASRALASNGSGKIAAALTTLTELQGLNALTASRAIATTAGGILTASAVTATELGYLAGVTAALQTQIDALLGKAPKNLLRNGAFDVWDQGGVLNAATLPQNNDATYLLPGWCLLSDGNNIVEVARQSSSPPVGSRYFASLTTQTGNKQFGLIQFLEANEAIKLRSKTVSLSLQACYSGSTVGSIKIAILEWTSTADSITRDVVSAWGATPTYAANWAAANTPVSQVLSGSFQTFKVENITLGSTFNNLAVFIFVDDTTITSGDALYLGQIQLEISSKATEFIPAPFPLDQRRCRRFYFRLTGDASGNSPAISAYASAISQDLKTWIPFPVEMRTIPSPHVEGNWAKTNCTGPTVANLSPQGFAMTVTSSGAGLCSVQTNDANDYIEFSAEL